LPTNAGSGAPEKDRSRARAAESCRPSHTELHSRARGSARPARRSIARTRETKPRGSASRRKRPPDRRHKGKACRPDAQTRARRAIRTDASQLCFSRPRVKKIPSFRPEKQVVSVRIGSATQNHGRTPQPRPRATLEEKGGRHPLERIKLKCGRCQMSGRAGSPNPPRTPRGGVPTRSGYTICETALGTASPSGRGAVSRAESRVK